MRRPAGWLGSFHRGGVTVIAGRGFASSCLLRGGVRLGIVCSEVIVQRVLSLWIAATGVVITTLAVVGYYSGRLVSVFDDRAMSSLPELDVAICEESYPLSPQRPRSQRFLINALCERWRPHPWG